MTGLKKEIYTLAWPAAAVLALATLPSVWVTLAGAADGARGWPLQAALSAFVVGMAVLAALPFGAEFQQRTLGLVLSQPVSRARVWFEKWCVLAAVLLVLAAARIAALGGAAADGRVGVRESTFMVAMASSGFLWTLVARSTIGGAAFTLAALAIVEMAASVITSRLTGHELDPFATHPAMVTMRLAYAVATLWLGWRLFATFELKAQGESSGAVPMAVLEAIPALRCRPAGAIANLVRKELRLQQPTFLIAALLGLCWLAAMLMFSIASVRPGVAEAVFAAVFISGVPLLAVVCGTISIGEDTALGVRAWHLTLPVPAATQWAVKALVTLAVGLSLGFALPLALAQLTPAFVTLPAATIQLPPAGRIAPGVAALLVISFWSATLFGQTVKAAVAAGAAVLLLWLCVVLGSAAGQRLDAGSEWLTALMVANQWSPQGLLPLGANRRGVETTVMWTTIAVLAMVALLQSRKAFRAPDLDRRRIARYGVALAVAAFAVSFIPSAYWRAAYGQYQSQPVLELEAALQHLSVSSLAATGQIPGSVSADELDATGQLSEDARRWLAGSRISLRASPPRSQAGERVMYVRSDVSFPNGRTFRMLYRLPPAR